MICEVSTRKVTVKGIGENGRSNSDESEESKRQLLKRGKDSGVLCKIWILAFS